RRASRWWESWPKPSRARPDGRRAAPSTATRRRAGGPVRVDRGCSDTSSPTRRPACQCARTGRNDRGVSLLGLQTDASRKDAKATEPQSLDSKHFLDRLALLFASLRLCVRLFDPDTRTNLIQRAPLAVRFASEANLAAVKDQPMAEHRPFFVGQYLH